jgi:O-antigen ligase
MIEDFSLYPYAPYWAWLTILISLWFSLLRPAANMFLPIAVPVFGPVKMGLGFSFAQISSVVAVFCVAGLLSRTKCENALGFNRTVLGSNRMMFFTCSLILAKIICETGFYGLDEYRSQAFYGALFESIIPIALLWAAAIKISVYQLQRQILLGFSVYPTIIVFGSVLHAFDTGLVQASLQGLGRLQLGRADTITSAKIICMCLMGICMVSKVFLANFRRIAVLVYFLTLPILMLLLLIGTRQYLLVAAVFLFLWARSFSVSNLAQFFTNVAVFALVVVFLISFAFSRDLVMLDRFSKDALKEESTENRGAIWNSAFIAFLEHPLMGTGFKNFGEVLFLGFGADGRPIFMRDTAHGVLQDVFTEHGVFLGCFFLVGWVKILLFTLKFTKGNDIRLVLAICLISMQFALVFSSSFFTATPIYMMALLVQVWSASSRDEKNREWLCQTHSGAMLAR